MGVAEARACFTQTSPNEEAIILPITIDIQTDQISSEKTLIVKKVIIREIPIRAKVIQKPGHERPIP